MLMRLNNPTYRPNIARFELTRNRYVVLYEQTQQRKLTRILSFLKIFKFFRFYTKLRNGDRGRQQQQQRVELHVDSGNVAEFGERYFVIVSKSRSWPSLRGLGWHGVVMVMRRYRQRVALLLGGRTDVCCWFVWRHTVVRSSHGRWRYCLLVVVTLNICWPPTCSR